MNYKFAAGAVGAVILIAGLQIYQWHAENTNPPFTNRLTSEETTPITIYQPQQVSNATAYTQLTVYTATGKKVVLNAATTPLLFEAYWCPHCQRTLVLLNKKRAQLRHFPTLISTGFVPGTSLQSAVHLTDEEATAFGIHHVQTYYLLADWHSLVPEFPMLIFRPAHGQVEKLVGEHTFSVWQQAINHSP